MTTTSEGVTWLVTMKRWLDIQETAFNSGALKYGAWLGGRRRILHPGSGW